MLKVFGVQSALIWREARPRMEITLGSAGERAALEKVK